MIDIFPIDQLDLNRRKVIYRVDYNVPLEGTEVSDGTRIEETLPTIFMMRERGASIVIISHLGRPKGKRRDADSLRPIRAKLEELSNVDVQWGDDCIGEKALSKSKALGPGQILLLENLRFHAEEEKNDPGFARELRKHGEVYVNDAFGACHRAHASIVSLPALFPKDQRAGGLLLLKELQFLQKVTHVTDRPFVAILGGAKIAGKIEPLEALVKLADRVVIGGGMSNTFLAAQGRHMGESLVDRDSIEVAKRILGSSASKVLLPADLVVTDSIDKPARVETVDVEKGVPPGLKAVDIGPKTIERFSAVISEARTIFWNGPMGVFEQEPFAKGTREIARAVAHANATTIVGGGESVEAVNSSGFADRISHISTGGGASLEFVAGSSLPGIEILRR